MSFCDFLKFWVSSGGEGVVSGLGEGVKDCSPIAEKCSAPQTVPTSHLTGVKLTAQTAIAGGSSFSPAVIMLIMLLNVYACVLQCWICCCSCCGFTKQKQMHWLYSFSHSVAFLISWHPLSTNIVNGLSAVCVCELRAVCLHTCY